MSDAADYLTETGEEMFLLHQLGECGLVGPCPYCDSSRPRKRRPMAEQKSVSGIFQKLGKAFDQEIKAHVKDETRSGFQKLPGNISGGIAELKEIGFGEYKKGDNQGKPFFRLAATVKKPRTTIDPTNQEIVTIRGGTTSIMVPLCDTKDSDGNTIKREVHVAAMLNHLRLLGGDEFVANANGANIEALCAQLKKAKPPIHTKFSTTLFQSKRIDPKTKKPYPPKIYENWHGAIEYSEEEGQGVQDDTGGSPESNGEAIPDEMPPEQSTDEDNQEAFDETAGDNNISGLLERANSEDTEAQDKLAELAEENGWTEEQVTNARDWEAVAYMVEHAPGEEPQEEPKEKSKPASEWKPKKGETCKYKPDDPKIKKPVQCEIISVNSKQKTCDLKNLVNQKVYKEVKLSDLQQDE